MSLKFFVKSCKKTKQTVNKTTCRMHSANSGLLCADQLKSFPTAMIIF